MYYDDADGVEYELGDRIDPAKSLGNKQDPAWAEVGSGRAVALRVHGGTTAVFHEAQ